MDTTPNRGIVVISGGSAANNLVEVFDAVRESKNCLLSYIIPISDNGGSSSELIRIFGGPGIGDVRSKHWSTRLCTVEWLFDFDYRSTGAVDSRLACEFRAHGNQGAIQSSAFCRGCYGIAGMAIHRGWHLRPLDLHCPGEKGADTLILQHVELGDPEASPAALVNV